MQSALWLVVGSETELFLFYSSEMDAGIYIVDTI